MIDKALAQELLEWQEAVTALEDSYFFDIVRIYLGPPETPFNKQNVIKKLSAFLRKEQNKSNIISLLDDDDIKILNVIPLLKNCTLQMLLEFFRGSEGFKNLKTHSDFYARIANLEDRLVIFHLKKDGKTIIKINPMLKEELETTRKKTALISEASFTKTKDTSFPLSREFIASFISYLYFHKNLTKIDGTLKRKNAQELSGLFEGCSEERFEAILRGLKNLRILSESDEGFECDREKLKTFSLLSFSDCCFFLCAACTGNFSRSTLQKNAELIKNIFSATRGHPCTKETLLQCAFITAQKNSLDNTPSRFVSLMSKTFEDGNNFSSGITVYS